MTISQFPLPAGGIPTGDTAGRPASPVIGDVYYNGELGILEIFNGTNFIACSAPSAAPTIAVTDVGTSVAYGSAQGAVTITEALTGGTADSFIISSSTGGYSATTTGTTVTITVGNNGSYTFSGKSVNVYGESAPGQTITETLTTVPQAPTIGTANDVGVVTWTLNSDGGKNLSAITITPFLNGTTAQTATTAATTSSTSATITTGITEGSAYTFKVKTTNANGDSLESSASNSVTINKEIAVGYLVVAGGGGSCNNGGGGGGAGGLRSTVTATGGGGSLETALNITKSTNYTVTVGASGAGGVNPNQSTNGGNSVFSTITSTGGGGGQNFVNGADGGSGSGAHRVNTVGLGTANQGFDGAQGLSTGDSNAGGGGGAGGAGSAATGSAVGGNGGLGVAVSITGSSVNYAGGGAGGGASGGTASFGGGAGGSSGNNGANGSANTGGGGGGGGANSGTTGGTGGSGVVILRWLTADGTITVGAGLTADATGTDGSHSYKRFTAGSGNVSFS